MQTTDHKKMPASDAEKAELARKAKNQYQREYRRKNPERVKHWYIEYWSRKAMTNEEAKTE